MSTTTRRTPDEFYRAMSDTDDETDNNEVRSGQRDGVVGRADVPMSTEQLDELVALVDFVLDDREVDEVEVGVHVVDVASIAALNQMHMGVEGPTDVLSFPIDEAPDPTDPSPRMLGEIVVCPEIAARSARASRSGLEDELRLLVVHGALHLLGMDHDTEQGRLTMSTMQNDLRDRWADQAGVERPEPVHLMAHAEDDSIPRVEVDG